MIEGMTVKECWRAMRLVKRPEDHSNDQMHGTFGTLTLFEAPETVPVIRFNDDRRSKDTRLVVEVSTVDAYPGSVRIFTDNGGLEHVFKLLRELEVEKGAADVTVTAVTAHVNPRARA